MKINNLLIPLIFLVSLNLLAATYTLEQAISTALENNESVRSAAQELEKSEYIYNEAFSGALPKVEANLTYLRNLYSSKISNMSYYLTGMANGLAGLNNTILDLHPESSLNGNAFFRNAGRRDRSYEK
jgi:outer membrane protein TolC